MPLLWLRAMKLSTCLSACEFEAGEEALCEARGCWVQGSSEAGRDLLPALSAGTSPPRLISRFGFGQEEQTSCPSPSAVFLG